MEITKLNNAPKVPFDLDGHIMGQNSKIELIHLNLKAGQKLEKHINPNDVFFYVLEGKAMLETDQERELVVKDHCIFMKGNTNRGFDNISISDFKVLVVKIL